MWHNQTSMLNHSALHGRAGWIVVECVISVDYPIQIGGADLISHFRINRLIYLNPNYQSHLFVSCIVDDSNFVFFDGMRFEIIRLFTLFSLNY